jgi:osmoprotectant transport system substrate-binding protein
MTTATVPQRSLLPYVVLAGIAATILWALVASGMWTDILRYRKDVVYLTRQHLFLVGVSGSLAIVSGIGAGIWLSRPWMARYAEATIQAVNMATAIPTLGKLALMMALLGIGALPAIVGLWIATLLPIIRNTYVGIRSVPEHLIDAAHVMGMSAGAILRRVELPNALFVMFAGVRTAMAVNVGTAPIAFPIGGGLDLIFTGIDLQEFGMMPGRDPDGAARGSGLGSTGAILAGAARSQSYAEFVGNEEATMKKAMQFLWAGVVAAAVGWAGGASAQTIVVGGKAFTEQQIMTAMTVALLKAKGFTPERKAGMGSAAVRSALENGQIDVYWEYTGTALMVFNKINDKFATSEEAYRKIKEVDGAKGIVWLNMAPANNTYGFAMNKDQAAKLGIVTMSDFAKAIKGGAKLTFASNAEFYARPDGLPGWQTAYGFEFDRDNVKRMDTGLTYSALKDRQVDSAVVFATDGRIPAFNFVVLKDDKNYASPYNMTPVVRKEILDKNPKIADALNALAAKLDNETMGKLNASVDVDKKTPEEVAEQYLKVNGMI